MIWDNPLVGASIKSWTHFCHSSCLQLVCVITVCHWALRGIKTSLLTACKVVELGRKLCFFHPQSSPGLPELQKCRRVALVWARAADNQPRRLTIHSAVLILVGMIRWSRDGDDDGDGDAEGLRPAPDFHTWSDSNKGRDLQTPLTPNNTGHPPNTTPPRVLLKTPLSVCLSVRLNRKCFRVLNLRQVSDQWQTVRRSCARFL